MKVLHVTATDQRRGAEIFASDLARWLMQHGVHQTVTIMRPGSGQVDFPVDTRRAPAGGQTRRVVWLRRHCKLHRPDVVQAHGGEAMKACILAGLHHYMPVVYRRIGMAPRWLRRGPRRMAYAWLMNRCSATVALSHTMRTETVERFRIDPDRIVVIPNGVDLARLAPEVDAVAARGDLDIDQGAFVTSSIGALTWEKDPRLHLAVAEGTLAQIPRGIHLFVGDGPMRSELEDLVARSPYRDRLHILGLRRDIRTILAATDLVLHASREDGMEGMPAVLIEASMSGTPVVAKWFPGIDEVIDHLNTGLVIGSGRAEDLVAAIVGLHRDRATLERLGKQVQEMSTATWSMDAIGPRYVDLYERLCQ